MATISSSHASKSGPTSGWAGLNIASSWGLHPVRLVNDDQVAAAPSSFQVAQPFAVELARHLRVDQTRRGGHPHIGANEIPGRGVAPAAMPQRTAAVAAVRYAAVLPDGLQGNQPLTRSAVDLPGRPVVLAHFVQRACSADLPERGFVKATECAVGGCGELV